MNAYNVAYSINIGATIMVILDDTEDVVMFHTPEKAAFYVTELRDKGYKGEICVLQVKKIIP